MSHRISLERALEVARKEFRQAFRDPRLVRLIFVAPVLQLLVFGYAVSTDVRETRTLVVDYDNSRASRAVLDALQGGGLFRIIGRAANSSELLRALDRGRAVVGVVIPPGFSSGVSREGGARLQLLFDGTNSNVALVAQSHALGVLHWMSVRLAQVPPPSLELRERVWFNPDLLSRYYNVPAVTGLLLMLVCLLLTSLAVVREREIGTLEQLMVSPLRPVELIAGKTIPFACIALVDLVLVTAVALLWFGVPFRGSFLLLVLAAALYIMCGLGLGLLISTVSATQQEAFLTSFLVFMPAILLSGFMFPVSSMPQGFQYATLFNPIRHFLEIVRALFLKGAAFGDLWPQFAALTATAGFLLSLATLRFRKRIG